jgi:hypothetical protein
MLVKIALPKQRSYTSSCAMNATASFHPVCQAVTRIPGSSRGQDRGLMQRCTGSDANRCHVKCHRLQGCGRRLVMTAERQQEQQSCAPAPHRRGMLGLLAAVVSLPALQSRAEPAPGAAATEEAAPSEGAPAAPGPLPVPPLTETFISPEGFAFDYPAGWVVAFDRSGSSGNGAVVGEARPGRTAPVVLPPHLSTTAGDCCYCCC